MGDASLELFANGEKFSSMIDLEYWEFPINMSPLRGLCWQRLHGARRVIVMPSPKKSPANCGTKIIAA